MKIDWKRKLTSRKFWGAVVGFVTPLMVAFGATDSEVAQVAGVIMSGSVLVAYIIGEGLVDKAAVDSLQVTVDSLQLEKDGRDDGKGAER